MSVPPTEPSAGTVACPRCGAPVGPEQDWCLECGAAARTRLAPTPNWRAPIVMIAAVAILAVAGLGAAFVALTNDDGGPAAATTATAPAPAPAPTPAEPAATEAVPPVTEPEPATTPAPATAPAQTTP